MKRQVLIAFLTLSTVYCLPNYVSNGSLPYANLQFDPNRFNPLDFFMSYDETNQWLVALETKYSDKCKVQPIGKSYEGRDINAMYINYQQTKKVFVVANMHAREWAAMTSAIYIIHELVRNSNNYPEASQYQWIIVPMANPDGYEYTKTEDRIWRKNRSPQANNAVGVDLNRNFGYMWDLLMKPEDDNPREETYRGPWAFSEPECRAVGDFLQQNAASLVLFVDLHTYGEYIFIPYGYTKEPAPNAGWLLSVAQAGSKAITSRTGGFYLFGTPGELLYTVSGSGMDYCYSIGVKACIGIELTNGGFEIETSSIIPYGQEALAAVQAMAVKADEG